MNRLQVDLVNHSNEHLGMGWMSDGRGWCGGEEDEEETI